MTENNADGNIVVGYLSLNSNTTGYNNTALGRSVLDSNTTGTLTAIGEYSMYNNESGKENAAIGGFFSLM